MELSLLEELEQLLEKRVERNINFKNSEYEKLKSELGKVTDWYNEAENKISKLKRNVENLEKEKQNLEDKLKELNDRHDELKLKHKNIREEKFVLNNEYLKLLKKS